MSWGVRGTLNKGSSWGTAWGSTCAPVEENQRYEWEGRGSGLR